MLRTPNRLPRSGCSSVLIFTTFTLPARSLATFSTAGATIRHGPHQGAQNSASTGRGLGSPLAWKSALVSAASHGSGEPHFAHWGTPAAAVWSRFFCPHVGQVTTLVSLISLLERFPERVYRKRPARARPCTAGG